MNHIWALVVGVITLAIGTNAQNTTLSEALSLIQTMPKCGSSCLLSGIANSTCEAADIPCTCNNKKLAEVVQTCVIDSCTVKQQLLTKNITETICQRPARDKRESQQRTVMIGLVFALIAFVLRILSKIHSPCTSNNGWSHQLWWDDAVMTLAVGLVVATTYSAVPMNKAGLATDIWSVSFSNITLLLKIYYWAEDVYLAALPTVKISLILTYLRFFSTRGFRIACSIVIGLNVAYGITFVLISVFQCNPIPLAWERWTYGDGPMPGHCNDINAQGWASAGANVGLDFLTLGLPMPMLWRLRLNKRKKFWLMTMFGVGFFVTIVSIIRLQVLIRFGNSKNLSWDYTAVGYWSTVELQMSVVCAAMPSIRNLLRRFMPGIMGTSSSARHGPEPSSGLSGRTAVSNGGVAKYPAGRSITINTMNSDEEEFIPMEEMHSHNKTAPLPPV